MRGTEDLAVVGVNQPSEGVHIVFFNCLNVYHKPNSGELQYKSRT